MQIYIVSSCCLLSQGRRGELPHFIPRFCDVFHSQLMLQRPTILVLASPFISWLWESHFMFLGIRYPSVKYLMVSSSSDPMSLWDSVPW